MRRAIALLAASAFLGGCVYGPSPYAPGYGYQPAPGALAPDASAVGQAEGAGIGQPVDPNAGAYAAYAYAPGYAYAAPYPYVSPYPYYAGPVIGGLALGGCCWGGGGWYGGGWRGGWGGWRGGGWHGGGWHR